MSRKLFAILVLALFVAGMVPISLAEDRVISSRLSSRYTASETALATPVIAQVATINTVNTQNVAIASVPAQNTIVATVANQAIAANVANLAVVNSSDSSSGASSSDYQVASVASNFADVVAVGSSDASEAGLGIRERLQENRDELKAAISEKIMDNDDARSKLEKAREDYQEAKDAFVSVQETYKAERAKFIEANDDYKGCRGIDSARCNEKQEELKKQAQPYLENAADLVLKELERIKEKIQSSEDLSDEEISRMTSDIELRINDVEAAKAKIESLGPNSTRDDINSAAKDIRDSWIETKAVLKRNAGELAIARLGNILSRTDTLEAKLFKVRDRLKAKGLDVSELDDNLSDFSSKLDTAAQNYYDAKSKFAEAKTSDDVEKAAKEVHSLLVEAKQSLKEARDLLREIVGEIRSLNNGALDVEANSTG